MIAVSMLLKSWATPPASLPIASSFCAWVQLLLEPAPLLLELLALADVEQEAVDEVYSPLSSSTR